MSSTFSVNIFLPCKSVLNVAEDPINAWVLVQHFDYIRIGGKDFSRLYFVFFPLDGAIENL